MNHYYIRKRGYYYRPNSSGYTENKFWAGTYTEKEIEDHKGCDELEFIKIDVGEHNRICQLEIDVIEHNKINPK